MNTRSLPNILTTILSRKAEEVAAAHQVLPIETLQERIESRPQTRPFVASLRNQIEQGNAAVIAEIKRASPSAGIIRAEFNPSEIAKSYEASGAAAISVLTDRDFFLGDLSDLSSVREACQLPLLRKEFIIDAYQLFEARAAGADAVLLIAAALDDVMLHALYEQSQALGMEVLIEVHDAEELKRAMVLKPSLIGINNRDLRTFTTRLETTLALLDRIPSDVLVVTESGIRTSEDVSKMRKAGVHAFLIGEAFMRVESPGEALKALIA